MATRREVNKQKVALSTALREQCSLGTLMPGEPAPSLRQLAEDFGISTRVANQVLQELIAEGLFHMVPRVGTFVGRPKAQDAEFYLMLLPDSYGLSEREDVAQIQHGFEERIAEKGSASIAMPLQNALDARASGELPPIVGLFDMSYYPDSPSTWGPTNGLARVGFSGRIEDPENSDEVSYDDIGGGRQATRHLMDLGHRQIAFLALHSFNDQTDELIWSHDREKGWRQALEAGNLATEGLAFYPLKFLENNSREQTRAGFLLGKRIMENPAITAVVAANDYAVAGFLEAARASGKAVENWPSLVGFDNRATSSGHLVSSMRLPTEHLGRTAADLVWERRKGYISGAPVHRSIAMRLIPRLTSRRRVPLMTTQRMDSQVAVSV